MDSRRQTVTRETSRVIDMPDPISARASDDRLLRLLRVTWSERRTIARFAAVTALVVAIATMFMSNTYRSTIRMMPPDKQNASSMAALASMVFGGKSGTGSGTSDVGMMAGGLLGMQSSGALFVAVLKSRTAQETVVRDFRLEEAYGHPLLRLRTSMENARRQLEDNTEIEEDRKSGIISLAVIDKDPRRAAAVAGGYVDELNRLLATLSTSAAGRERVFLEGELAKVKKDLDSADLELSQFASKNATLDPRDQGKAMVEAAASLEGQLIAAQSQLSGLQAIYTNQNVRVRSLNARIAELKKQLANQTGGGVDANNASDQGTNSELGFPSIRKLPLLGYTYADLYRRAKITETVYGVLTQQYESAKIQEAKEIPTVRVLDPADLPDRKYGPHRVLLTLIGALLGCLLGAAWVIARDRWHQRDEHDPYRLLVTEMAETCQRTRVWKVADARLRKVLDRSCARMTRAFRSKSGLPGPLKDGSGTSGFDDSGTF